MEDSEFIEFVDRTLNIISDQIHDLLNYDVDVDVDMSGSILNIKFGNGNHVVITSQIHLKELWLAALNKGGFHYCYDGCNWKDKRGGLDFHDRLSEILSIVAEREVIINL